MLLSIAIPAYNHEQFIGETLLSIKNQYLDDYEVIKSLIEDSEYTPYYDEIIELQMIIGNYGIVPAFLI